MSGVSFFPYDDHTYQQAPYERIERPAFESRRDSLPDGISFDNITYDEDTTTASQELACAGGACEL